MPHATPRGTSATCAPPTRGWSPASSPGVSMAPTCCPPRSWWRARPEWSDGSTCSCSCSRSRRWRPRSSDCSRPPARPWSSAASSSPCCVRSGPRRAPSPACALLHVSKDVSRKLTRELRVLGPNLLLVPEQAATATATATGVAPAPGGDYLDVADAQRRLVSAGLDAVPLLYMVATLQGRPIQVVGADLAAARR